jgi:cytochrome c5
MKQLLFVTLAAVVIAALSASPAPAGQKSVSITLPGQNTVFRPAPGVEVARADCLTCHSAEYVVQQPALSKAQWTAELTKMRVAYGATIPDADVETLVAYLLAQNPPKK